MIRSEGIPPVIIGVLHAVRWMGESLNQFCGQLGARYMYFFWIQLVFLGVYKRLYIELTEHYIEELTTHTGKFSFLSLSLLKVCDFFSAIALTHKHLQD